MRFVLTQAQLEGLKTHVYRSQGVSLIESLVLKRLWRWLVSLLPSSLAPNLITFAGFVIAMATSLAVILPDLNAEGKTLDGMDGIQARRIGLSTPLGEFFDHGLDAILTFVYAAVAGCSVGINEGYPFLGLLLGVAVLLLNFFYHWQTFVSGVLHFKTIDIAEAHYAQISVLCLSGLLGTHFWTNLFPGLALELKVVLVYGTLVFTVLNLLHAFYIILTCGVGKNGSTVADTSVLSPIISPIVITTTLVYHALYSPSQLVHTHYILFFSAFGIQVTKITLLMMVAGMTRIPYPLLDPIMVGPVLLCLNIHFPLIPDLLLMSFVAFGICRCEMCAHAHVKRGVFYYDISPRRKLIGTGVGRHEELLVLTVAKEESKCVEHRGCEGPPAAGEVRRKERRMSCAASRQFTRENGDYLVTANEVIHSPRCSYQVRVLDVLGRGTFGQVLKAWRADTSQLVALKVLKNIPSYTKQGQLEIDVLTRLSCQAAHEFNIVQAYESFSHCGHICISFELLEINLYDYLKQNRFQPLALKYIRPIAQQVLCCLQRLQQLGLVHSDIKPENIMLVDQARWPYRVKVIDFGSATSVSAGNATSYLQSRYYRAPEVILSLPYTEAIDMWSLGCVLAELYLGWPLFPGLCRSNEYDQISFIVSTLGPPPSCMLRNVRKACKFFSLNHLTYQWILKSPQQLKAESGIVSKETRKYIFHSLSDLTRLSSHGSNKHKSLVEQLDCLQFVSLLASMLTFDPSRRNLPSQALQSPFVTMHHLAAHTSDSSVRDWIQCMHVCRLSRTTNSSPPTPQLPLRTPLMQPSPLLAPVAPAHPLVLPPSLLATQLAFHPSHPISYHLSPLTYLPHHYSLLPQKSSLTSEDTGYASADSSPTPHLLPGGDHADVSHLCLHGLTTQQPSFPAFLSSQQQQLYSLHVGRQHPHTLTILPAPTSHPHTLTPHHPFSRL
ncbi:Homeodomain-interacting protein kinase 2 [Geodia barretti]|uniref:Homeodomain-interacting protein kinase 2 n=1 Tax=Geodia barretti TaxID=519541 RepID=A0AA35S8F8_GEOBA|nr:Homeodomain-interacting protein kinase 2 [Geodia barretti]